MAALRVITASLLLILISLSLRACSAPPPDPRRFREPESESEEEDPRAALMRELHELRTQTQLNHAQVIFMKIDLGTKLLLHDMSAVDIAQLIEPFAPDPATPRLSLDGEIRHIGPYPLQHEAGELVSGGRRFRLFNLTDDLIMNEEHGARAK